MGARAAPAPPVVLDPACFLNIVNSAIEVYNRETTGLLVGVERRRRVRGGRGRVVVLSAAYAIQTAERRVTWVQPGNDSAARRARSAPGSLGFHVVGEFHSHTNNVHRLSAADLEYAREALRQMNGTAPPRWLELVLGMRRKDYATAHRPGFTWRDYPRKVGCTVVVSPRVGFDIVIAGYWLRPNGGRLACEEATIHLPLRRRRANRL